MNLLSISRYLQRVFYYGSLSLILPLLFASKTLAQTVSNIPPDWKVIVDTIWVLVTGMLIFFMNAGFAMLETGFCRGKNAVNILSKNFIVFAIASLIYWMIGFAFMFGNGNGFIGWNGFFLIGNDNSPLTGTAYQGVFSALSFANIPLNAKFFFQLVFAGTAATIVSGAVAERIKFVSFLLFSLLLVGIGYSIVGHWIWGNGWLKQLGFWDFAGSTVVHSVGGWSALVGAFLLGPRLEKYVQGQMVALPGHNMGMATLGGLILWLGWFGFNPGSALTANPPQISHLVVVTNLAGASGGLLATLVSWFYFGKPDLSMIINGVLVGLVSVTASCNFIPLWGGVVIGAIGGIVVVFSVLLLEKLKIDDPVGAVSVHLVGGIWGTIAVGLFSVGSGVFPWYPTGAGPIRGLFFGGGFAQLSSQFIGIIAVGSFMLIFSLMAWFLIGLVAGLRVQSSEEIQGLDLSEHGMEAYTGLLRDQ